MILNDRPFSRLPVNGRSIFEPLKKSQKRTSRSAAFREYESPFFYVVSFYILLSVWTGVCIILLGAKALNIGWPVGQLLMIAFVLAYTWYFSLGIAYRVRFDTADTMEFISVRRRLMVSIDAIEKVEGPRFTVIPYCFIRFRLEREKAYLFCRITDETLHRMFYAVRRANPDIEFKGLPMVV